MAYRSFYSDDDTKPGDPDFGYGYFADENGQKTYGYDPVEAERLYQPTPPPQAQPTASLDEQQLNAMIAQQSGIPTGATGMPPAQSAGVPDVQPRPITPQEVQASTPTSDFDSELQRQAQAANINPELVRSVIRRESGGNPAAVNDDTGAHAGLIQFSQKGWPDVAKGAGRPDVSWDDMRRMSATDQLPFVMSYFQRHGIGPKSDAGDLAMAAFMPAYSDRNDDFVLGEKDNPEIMGDVRSSKVWAQNPIFDRDKDGKITVGEVRSLANEQAGMPGRDREIPTGVPSQAAFGAPGIPQIPGMQAAQVTSRGLPLSPEQLRERQQQTYDSTMQQMAMVQHGAEQRVAGRDEAMAQVDAEHQRMLKDTAFKQQYFNAVKGVARQKVDEEFRKPMEKVDPLKVIKDMDAGDWVLGGIAILLSGLGSGFRTAAGGQPGPNAAIQAMNRAIDQSIAAQKDAIQRGERLSNNRVAHWTTVFNDAQSGQQAAEAEAKIATARRIDMQTKLGLESADITAQAMGASQQLMQQGQQLAQAIEDREAERLSVVYQPPKPVPVPPVGPVPVATMSDGKRVDPIEQSPELRDRLVADFMQMSPEHRAKQLGDFQSDMANVSELKRSRDRLRKLYEIEPNEKGAYPPDQWFGGPDYSSTATGTGLSPANWGVFSNERDRELEKAWGAIKLATRMGWKTEPNNKAAQDLFEGLDTPARDTDVPVTMEELDRKIDLLEQRIKGGALPQVRAFYYSQNASAPNVRPVTGPVR